MIDANDGWAVGDNGMIMHWDGDMWTEVATPTDIGLFSVFMVSSSEGWAVGKGFGVDGMMIHWDGTNWNTVTLPLVPMLHSVYMVSENDGWAVGVSGWILHWDGTSWNIYTQTEAGYAGQHLSSVYMISANDGWAVGSTGTIIHWDGTNWNMVKTPITTQLNSVFMVSTDDVWAVGSSGTILHWDGTSWNEVTSPTNMVLNSVSMAGPDDGWAVGDHGTIIRFARARELDKTAPTADAGPDQEVDEETLVTFDGSASEDNVGVTSYTWTFLDVTQQTQTGVNPTYTFETPGTYIVTLEVTDAVGNHATDTVNITVLDVTDPVAEAGSDQMVKAGETVSFDAGGSSDNVGIASYEWDFGDGTTGSGVTTTHTYKKPETYTVTLTLKDEAGNVDTDSLTVSVEKKGCIIATATYGSELSPEVQFLRGFRDDTALNTFAGSSFMTVFNTWYYSFSPEVALVIAANDALRCIMKILLYPLIGILHITTTTYSLISFNREFAIMVSGLIASSLIGIIYISPLALIIHVIKKVKVHPRTLRAGSMIWGLSIGGIAVAEITRWSAVMMFSTAVFVFITMILATLSSVKYVARYIQH